jgi:prepilin-type N-terminal cleavage/methylation domain-containing protein
MKVKSKQSGLTLMEMTVVTAVVAMLAVFGLPAIRALINSFESEGGAKVMISAALASGRAIAAKEQHYAGVRFQKLYDPNDPDPLKAPQYMVFIIHDPEPEPNGTDLANGFRAVEGIKPIKLPDAVGVMEVVNDNGEIDDTPLGEVTDKTTFSIVFSPSGKLIIHDVRVRNRNGKRRGNNSSKDDIFNTKDNVTDPLNPVGMFIQDDYAELGLDEEPSRRSFIVYDKLEFGKVDENRRWSDYLEYLELIYINPYTGTMIKK